MKDNEYFEILNNTIPKPDGFIKKDLKYINFPAPSKWANLACVIMKGTVFSKNRYSS